MKQFSNRSKDILKTMKNKILKEPVIYEYGTPILIYCKAEYEVHKYEKIRVFMNYLLDLRDTVDEYKLQGKKKFELREYNIKNMDSLHSAYAESLNIDYLITTDRLLINASKRANLKVKVINPIEFIMEVI